MYSSGPEGRNEDWAVDGYTLRPERESDVGVIDLLHRDAFGDDKVPTLVRSLRHAPRTAPISLLAVDAGDAVVGHVMLSVCRLDAPARLVDVMTLSPLAVATPDRRKGLGTWLVRAGLATAENRGIPLVFIEGDPRRYARLGFRPAGPLGFRRPSLRIPEAAFQVYPLQAFEAWMTGTFIYSEAFWLNDCVGLR